MAGTLIIKSPEGRRCRGRCLALEQLPNIGPSLAADLRLIGIACRPTCAARTLSSSTRSLCATTGQRHDPCVLDTFMAATDFMRGAPAAPWWKYTAERKATFGAV